jgi:hypothetical protein
MSLSLSKVDAIDWARAGARESSLAFGTWSQAVLYRARIMMADTCVIGCHESNDRITRQEGSKCPPSDSTRKAAGGCWTNSLRWE